MQMLPIEFQLLGPFTQMILGVSEVHYGRKPIQSKSPKEAAGHPLLMIEQAIPVDPDLRV